MFSQMFPYIVICIDKDVEQGFAGLEQSSANYLGLNRILRDSWPHGPLPHLIRFNVY